LGIEVIISNPYNEIVMAERSRIEIVLEALAFVTLVAMFVMVGNSWTDLPGRIPVHFSFSGRPDGWGGKDSIWILPGLGVFLYGFLSFSRGRPEWTNVPFSLDKCDPEVLAILNQFLLVTKASVMLVLGILCWRSVEVAVGRAAGLGIEFLPVTLVLIFAPMIVYLVKLSKYRLN